MTNNKYDFSGWVTKNDLRCSDGKTIRHGAFRNMDGQKVPLVWQHLWNDPSAVLGYVELSHRDDGVYGYAYFNDTPNGQHAQNMVTHGDVTSLSIHANRLRMRGQDVLDGDIKEVSLVLAGANPGAYIDQVSLSHGDDGEIDEAIIYTGYSIEHADNQEGATMPENTSPAGQNNSSSETTVEDVFNSMTEEQKNVVYFLIGQALEGGDPGQDPSVQHSDMHFEDDDDEFISADEFLTHMSDAIRNGFTDMTRNVFESANADNGLTLSHSQLDTILEDAKKGGSYRDSFLQHAQDYGIKDIDILFPDARTLQTDPEFIKRRTEWVNTVLDGTKHSPFSRVKTVLADITADEARAKGYAKNTQKRDEIIKLIKRTTSPATIYKKQKLDRDDILDITSLDVISYLKGEMRLMLDEELARAILLGDGRDSDDQDKIKDPVGAQDGQGIRSILNDDDMYTHKVTINKALSDNMLVEYVLRSRTHFRGSGTPVFFTTDGYITDALLAKDKIGRPLYESVDDLAKKMRVSAIIPVEVMEEYTNVVGILVSLTDYTIGADKGGETSFFDDFDIDYNQLKYLLETRLSGGLTKPKSAIALLRTELDETVPRQPGFNSTTNTLTSPEIAGVEYRIDDNVVTGTITMTEDTEVSSYPVNGYVFPTNIVTTWTFTFTN